MFQAKMLNLGKLYKANKSGSGALKNFSNLPPAPAAGCQKQCGPSEGAAGRRGEAGFTLVEVVAAAALIGLLFTMLMPSLSGAYNKVKNSRLQNDLATVDQAIELYKMEKGTLPESLTVLRDEEYFTDKTEFSDAQGSELTYTKGDNLQYTLSGKNTKGESVVSPGSLNNEENP